MTDSTATNTLLSDPNIRAAVHAMGANPLKPNPVLTDFITQSFTKYQQLDSEQTIDPADAVTATFLASHPTQLATSAAMTLAFDSVDGHHLSEPMVLKDKVQQKTKLAFDLLFGILSTYAVAGLIHGKESLATTPSNPVN